MSKVIQHKNDIVEICLELWKEGGCVLFPVVCLVGGMRHGGSFIRTSNNFQKHANHKQSMDPKMFPLKCCTYMSYHRRKTKTNNNKSK